MFHTTCITRHICRTQLNKISNYPFRHISTSTSRLKSKFDLSDDLTSGPHDLIGPPRTASNLRPVKFAVCILAWISLEFTFINAIYLKMGLLGEGWGVPLGGKAEEFKAGDPEVQPGLVDRPQ